MDTPDHTTVTQFLRKEARLLARACAPCDRAEALLFVDFLSDAAAVERALAEFRERRTPATPATTTTTTGMVSDSAA